VKGFAGRRAGRGFLGLDVTMDDSASVCICQPSGNLARDPEGFVERESFLSIEPVAKGLTVHVRHHVIQGSVHLARVVERKDVGMLQSRRRLYLPQKTLGAQ
jgi:hypothetical protein